MLPIPLPTVDLDLVPVSDDDALVFDPSCFLVFPTSSVRDDPLPPPRSTQPSVVSHISPPASSVCSPSYRTYKKPRHYIAQGVLENGTLTVAHPDVCHFLDQACSDSLPPVPTSRPIFALVALALFYHPKRPGHWLFWSKPKRDQTARVVQKVLNTPNLISSPISWLGIAENLSIVANLQFGWKEYLSDLEWFAPYADTKSKSGPTTRMSLRKRKQPPQQSSSSASSVPTPQVTPTECIATSTACAASNTANDVDIEAVDDPSLKPPAKKKARICHSEHIDLEIPQLSAARPPSRQHCIDPPVVCKAVRVSERQKARKAAALEVKEAVVAVKQPPVRQTSRMSSCAPSDSSTVVPNSCWPDAFLPSESPDEPRSPSDLSGVTVVEADTNTGAVEVVESKPGQKCEKDVANKDKTTTAAPARARARRDAASGKKAQVVVASAKKQAQQDAVKASDKSKKVDNAKTPEPVTTSRPKKKRRTRR